MENLENLHFHDKEYVSYHYIYYYHYFQSHNIREMLRKQLKFLFRKKIKRKCKSLKQICIQNIINFGIKCKRDHIPNELFEDIISYKNKHEHLFPTIQSQQLMNVEKITIGKIFIREENFLYEYDKYWMYNYPCKGFAYRISADFDNRLNLYITNYIKMGSKFNKYLRRDPNIDMPILNYLTKN